MNRPSQFKICKWPENLYQQDCFVDNHIQQRFLVSKSLIRHQNYNLHFGIDLLHNNQIVIASILEHLYPKSNSKYANDEVNRQCGSQLIWQGFALLNKSKHYFKIYKKSGCLLIQYLSQNKISIQKLYILLLMSLQLLCKIHKLKGNLIFFLIKSLQLLESAMYSFTCVFNKEIIVPNHKKYFKIGNRKSKQLVNSTYNQQAPNDKRDVKIILQKLLQLKIKYYRQENQISNSKGLQFEKFIKKFINEIDSFIETQMKISQRCYKIVQKLVEQLKINIIQQKFQIRKYIQKKNAINKQNLQYFCHSFHHRRLLSNRQQADEDSQLESQANEDDSLTQTQISQYIENHILQVKILKQN